MSNDENEMSKGIKIVSILFIEAVLIIAIYVSLKDTMLAGGGYDFGPGIMAVALSALAIIGVVKLVGVVSK